jgi:hydrogenase maturation protease
MQTLLIALGNPLRGDDGAAGLVADRLQGELGITTIRAFHVLPELAEQVAAADTVFLVDADVQCEQPHIELLVSDPSRRSPISHSVSASEVVTLARRLYGFHGRAYLCHIPALRFGSTEGVSLQTEKAAESIAVMIRELLLREHGGE